MPNLRQSVDIIGFKFVYVLIFAKIKEQRYVFLFVFYKIMSPFMHLHVQECLKKKN